MKDPHAPNELAVFSGFVNASGLPVAAGSVIKRPPPAPDILCEVAGEGPVAFELLELLDQDRVARPRGIQDEVEDGFRDGFRAMPEGERDRMVKRLGNATVRVVMNPNVSSSRRRTAVGPVLRILLDADERFEGEYPLPGKLGDLAKVTIVRGNFSGPRFKSITATAYDPIPAGGLARKFKKSYKSSAPVELLAYFAGQHAPPIDEVQRLIREVESSIGFSVFRRVWVYDSNRGVICGMVQR